MTWQTWLKTQKTQTYFHQLQTKLHQAYAQKLCLPRLKRQVLRALQLTPLTKIKVVILGQDPYPNPQQANGLAFSVNRHQALPKSLNNIFQALKNDYPQIQLVHGDLTSWAQQGVFLLNTCLTVQPFRPNSHQNWGWKTFTTNLMQMLNRQNQPIVFLLWGKAAQAYAVFLNNPHHLILKAAHPSPLSAHLGFLKARHFWLANQFLQKNRLPPIDWNLN